MHAETMPMSLPLTADQFLHEARTLRQVEETNLTEWTAASASPAETEPAELLADRLVQLAHFLAWVFR
jgi:hypothetical protein